MEEKEMTQTWEESIKWIDQTSRKAENIYDNYEAFIKNYPELKDKFYVKNKINYFDNKPFDKKLDKNFIASLLKTHTNLSDARYINLVITKMFYTAPVIESDDDEIVDNIQVAPQFQCDWDSINDNIEDKELINDLIKKISIVPTPKTNSEQAWDEYKEWLFKGAMKKYNKDGEITGYVDSYINLVGWINHYPLFKDKFRFNELTEKVEFDGKPLSDELLHTVTQALCKYFLPNFSNLNAMYTAIIGAGCQNHINPVQDYFKTLKYDDSRNWIRWFITDVLNCEDEQYFDLYEAELTKFMVAFIKRNVKENYYKDIKFDNMLALTSEVGGSGKSTVFKKLFEFGGISYCQEMSNKVANTRDKDLLMNMHQSACVNFDEININGRVVTDMKTFIQQTRDNYRVPYGHVNEDRIRHFVFGATSNNNDFLKDYTTITERKWWIIHISENKDNGVLINKMFDDNNLKLKDKLWSQAMEIYKNNPDTELWLSDPKLQLDLDNVQENYKITNNSDYNEISNILDGEWGYSDASDINVNLMVEQYSFDGTAEEWSAKHNEEIHNKQMKDGYIMSPDDRFITYFGHIDRINCAKLHNIIKKLNINFNIKALKNALSKKWEQKQAKINGKNNQCYVRIEPFNDKRQFTNVNSNKCENNYENDNSTTIIGEEGLPF